VPGFAAHEDGSYESDFLLRHLLVIRDHEVARAFLRVHADLWAHAVPVDSATQLSDHTQFLR
jgi:hypothetical protein